MGAGFGIVVLTGETQRAVEGTVGGRRAGTPQGGPGPPGKLPVGVEEFGGSTDQIGNDGMEPGVKPRLLGDVVAAVAAHSRVGRAAFGLGERPETAGLPLPRGDPRRRIVPGDVPLLGEDGAVPGEVDPFAHPAVVAGAVSLAAKALLGDPPAERIIGIPPVPTVRRGDTGQPIVGIPAVVPGTWLTRQPLVLA